MLRFFMTTVAVLIGAVTLSAQNADKSSHPFFISVQGGGLVSLNENYFSYGEHGKTSGLLDFQGGLALGYEFDNRYGMRLAGSYGKNAGAANSRETGNGFFPYSFSSANVFADVMFSFVDREKAFVPKIYVGAGGAYTFGFTDSGHPWQEIKDPNIAFGFRGGVIAQYNFNNRVGLFADLCGEFYTDGYNGLQPGKATQDATKGYAGFPFDMRGVLSAGLVFHL